MVFQTAQLERIEPVAAALEVGVVRLPRRDGIVPVGAGAAEDSLPKALDGFVVAQSWKDLARPHFARHGRDAPLIFILHRVPVRLCDLEALALGARPLVLIHAAEPVRVVGIEIDVRGQLFRTFAQALLCPRLYRAKRFVALVFYIQPQRRGKAPLNADLARARAVALINEHFKKIRLLRLGADNDLLPRLNIDAHARNEPRIRAKLFPVHNNSFIKRRIARHIIFLIYHVIITHRPRYIKLAGRIRGVYRIFMIFLCLL